MANLPLCSHRYFLMVSYMGTRYNGSQRLVDRDKTGIQDTVQEALEVALEAAFVRKRCRLTAGSRTDKGVHALMNCFTLPLIDYAVPTTRFKRLVNEKLIKDRHEIVVNEVLLVPAEFHPQKSASFPASELFRILPIPRLDVDKFEAAANLLRGTHDFKSFCYRPKETDDTTRTLEINVVPAGEMPFGQERSRAFDIYNIHFKSRSFLYNQVRRMIGSMLSYASFGSAELDDIQRLLDEPSADAWNPRFVIAEPWGLYLSRLNYDKSSFAGSIRTHEDANDQEKVDLDELPIGIDSAVEALARGVDLGAPGDSSGADTKKL